MVQRLAYLVPSLHRLFLTSWHLALDRSDRLDQGPQLEIGACYDGPFQT